MAPQSTAMNAPAARALLGVDGARDQFLASAALSHHQHVASVSATRAAVL